MGASANLKRAHRYHVFEEAKFQRALRELGIDDAAMSELRRNVEHGKETTGMREAPPDAQLSRSTTDPDKIKRRILDGGKFLAVGDALGMELYELVKDWLHRESG
jgi:hypothetical protein